MNSYTIGFIGQGFVGKNLANNFQKRGFKTIRYSLEKEYLENREAIKNCDIVFIAVPTPTINGDFVFSAVEDALKLIGPGKIAVIKSTVLPETTNKLQTLFSDIFIVHNPEFLRERHAEEDTDFPERNIIGIPTVNELYNDKAALVLSVLPKAPFNKIVQAKESELIKYVSNCFLYEKIVFFNQLYDLSKTLNIDYNEAIEIVSNDKRIGASHTEIFHTSSTTETSKGRGAGGHCLIKDFEAFINFYEKKLPDDKLGITALMALRDKNNDLLVSTNKDLDILKKISRKNLGSDFVSK